MLHGPLTLIGYLDMPGCRASGSSVFLGATERAGSAMGHRSPHEIRIYCDESSTFPELMNLTC